MSWKHVLDASHSALIDALNARFPKAMPELGLPKRLSAWTIPAPATQAWIARVTIDAGSAWLGIAINPESEKKFTGKGPGAQTWFKTYLDQVAAECGRRGAPAQITPSSDTPSASQMVSMPISVEGAPFFLLLGV